MVETKVAVLRMSDRCDAGQCGAQAYVKVTGITGELYFCAHHYAKADQDKLEAFAFETVDERDRLIENRLQGDD